MNLKQLYETLNGDYDDVLTRLISESFVERLVLKFLSEDSFALLTEAMQKGDVETAFRAAHTLKGVAQNLGFTALGKSASELTEALRPRTFDGTDELYRQVGIDYDLTVSALKTYAASLPPQNRPSNPEK